MLTDPPTRKNRSGFLESDRIKTLDLPRRGDSTEIAQLLESAMKAEMIRDVRSACTAFLESASKFYAVPTCRVRVLAERPLRTREHGAFELFGDYTPDSMLTRVWMRTAERKEVTSLGTFVSTLRHEFCHHLDFQKFGFPDSWHTRGFYERVAALYHHARGTPLKKLFWVPMEGGRWRSTGSGRIVARDHQFDCYEANTRDSWLCDIPCHRSGDRRRLGALADFPMSCWSIVAGNILLAGVEGSVGCSTRLTVPWGSRVGCFAAEGTTTPKKPLIAKTESCGGGFKDILYKRVGQRRITRHTSSLTFDRRKRKAD